MARTMKAVEFTTEEVMDILLLYMVQCGMVPKDIAHSETLNSKTLVDGGIELSDNRVTVYSLKQHQGKLTFFFKE